MKKKSEIPAKLHPNLEVVNAFYVRSFERLESSCTYRKGEIIGASEIWLIIVPVCDLRSATEYNYSILPGKLSPFLDFNNSRVALLTCPNIGVSDVQPWYDEQPALF